MKLFENQQIDVNMLPRVSEVDFLKPEKAYLRLTMIKSVLFWLFMFGIFSLCISAARQEYEEYLNYARFLFYPLALSSILLTWISYYRRGHALRDYDIIYKEGVLFKDTTTISFNRVQHCEVSQGPLDQLFDLFTLKVFTAGGQSSDLEIPGLNEQVAEGLKEFIIGKIASINTYGEEE